MVGEDEAAEEEEEEEGVGRREAAAADRCAELARIREDRAARQIAGEVDHLE